MIAQIVDRTRQRVAQEKKSKEKPGDSSCVRSQCRAENLKWSGNWQKKVCR